MLNVQGSYNCVPCGSGYYGMNITGGTCLIAEDLVKRCDPSYCARFHAICSYGVKCVCAVSKFAGVYVFNKYDKTIFALEGYFFCAVVSFHALCFYGSIFFSIRMMQHSVV